MRFSYSHSFGALVCGASLLFLGSVNLTAQDATARPLLRQLHGAAAHNLFSKVDRHQLPSGSDGDPSLAQTFLLMSPHAEPLGIVALYLNVNDDSSTGQPSQCGVFFAQEKGISRYVPVIGSPKANANQLCGGVTALGLAEDPGPHPALIFIFAQTMPHNNDEAEPFVFTWNSASGAYERDDKLNQWLWKQPRYPATVAQVRRLLRKQPQ